MHSFALSQDYPGIHDFRMELTALSYITKNNELTFLFFFSLPQMLFTGRKKTHVMFTQHSGEVEDCTSSTCCIAADQTNTENKNLFY